MTSKQLAELLSRAEQVLERFSATLPSPPLKTDWAKGRAWRWRLHQGRSQLLPIHHPHKLRLADLIGIDDQKAEVVRNTRQFLAGLPANNVLLWGARGTGKSSLIKALLNSYGGKGLRMIEADKTALADLPDIIDCVYARPERFILYCDDLSFEPNEPGYTALKATLDGSLAALPDNLRIYASSNRRHLLPESTQDNQSYHWRGDELHPGEGVEEKISLSERFGLWLSFEAFTQDEYLAIVRHWLRRLDVKSIDEPAIREALRFALLRGSRSGRVAWQFACDWAGRQAL